MAPWTRAALLVNLTARAQNSRFSLPRPALNPDARFSPFLQVSFVIFSSPEQGTSICLSNLFREIAFSLGYFPNGIWELFGCFLVVRSYFSCYRVTFFKPSLFPKLPSHPLLASHSPAVGPPPSFCFKLSYNGFAFPLIVLEYS